MIYVLLYKNSIQSKNDIELKTEQFIYNLQKLIIDFLRENLKSNTYKVIYCPKHIVEKNISMIDIHKDIVLFHPNVAGNNLSIVKKFTNSIVILKHKTVLLQKISERNLINENMALNNNFSLMYIEEKYDDETNYDWKLVSEPKIISIKNLIKNGK